jgi:outer membrane protein OmpA-like peptidoglycan-associated protein
MLLKKSIVILAALVLSMNVLAEEQKEEKVKGCHPYKVPDNELTAEKTGHWSIIPRLGFNAFDGDFNSEMKHNVAIPNAGIGFEYNFTPVWNIGLEYMYDMYTVTGDNSQPLQHADTLLCGDMHKAQVYLSMDLINLFFPKARKKIFSLFAQVGGGAGWYQSRKYYMDDEERNPTHQRGHTATYINADGVNGPDRMDGYKCLPFVNAGLTAEFNLNRTLALGIRADYSYYTKDYIDGRGFSGEASHASKNNDGIFDITLGLRIKVDAMYKNHVRNYAPYREIEDLAKRSAGKDTVIIHHDTVIIRESEKSAERHTKETAQSSMLGRTFYLYFDNAKSELTEQGLTIVQQLADYMANDTSIYLDVVGVCDNTGPEELNNKLAEARAKRVVNELQEEYNIPNDHCLTLGRGKVVGRRSKAAYGPNRRVEVRIISREDYLRLKELRQETAKVDAGVNHRESVNEVSLTSLARRHYGNPNCWVYIYEANKSKIQDINNMPKNLEVTLPILSDKQRLITAEEAQEYYNKIKQ